MKYKITAFERRIEMLFFLTKQRKSSIVELAKNYSVCRKTAYNDIKQRIEQHQAELKNLRTYISKNQNFLNSLYENLVNGIITQEEYQEMRTSYGDKISDTLRKINEVESRQAELEKQYSQYCDLSDAVSVITENNTLTKELINKLISKIEIYKGKKVEITYSFDNEFEGEVSANV